ncbi:hypothetical protein HER10_EVM0010746 [Colletotrichum scovillei]|uniref:uncharacterized protein n=1 Tax=Colletotrichum scovillei TaxID=1209932 RepID=UPI0015C368FD|nr:uncharacterized protein HER10_EVM0010746 [Colletotrichum scovillei]KAF4781355.1 hypothetical protein HER10_EVM0010746 [Colletotrichum scovillei]
MPVNKRLRLAVEARNKMLKAWVAETEAGKEFMRRKLQRETESITRTCARVHTFEEMQGMGSNPTCESNLPKESRVALLSTEGNKSARDVRAAKTQVNYVEQSVDYEDEEYGADDEGDEEESVTFSSSNDSGKDTDDGRELSPLEEGDFRTTEELEDFKDNLADQKGYALLAREQNSDENEVLWMEVLDDDDENSGKSYQCSDSSRTDVDSGGSINGGELAEELLDVTNSEMMFAEMDSRFSLKKRQRSAERAYDNKEKLAKKRRMAEEAEAAEAAAVEGDET